MVQFQAAALVGDEPQAAPLPGISPSGCLWTWQKCRLFWFCPVCYEVSFFRLLFSPLGNHRGGRGLTLLN